MSGCDCAVQVVGATVDLYSAVKLNPAVLARKESGAQQPIPTAWRPIICAIVRAFVSHDYQLKAGVAGVSAVSTETAEQISRYIQDYGSDLVPLPEATWDSSVCMWQEDRWDALIDLWSVSEGRSDLVLSLHVSEVQGGGLEFCVYMVYVP